MSSHPFIHVILLTVALTAGCVGAGDTPTTTVDPADDEGPTGAGAGDAPMDGDAPPDDWPDANATPRVDTPFAYDGTTRTMTCARAAGAGECLALTEGENVAVPLSAEGRPLELTATITWTPASPLTQNLLTVLLVDTGDGLAWNASYYADGPSPLTVTWDLSELPEDARLALYVGHWRELPQAPNAYGGVELEQDFSVDGVIATESA